MHLLCPLPRRRRSTDTGTTCRCTLKGSRPKGGVLSGGRTSCLLLVLRSLLHIHGHSEGGWGWSRGKFGISFEICCMIEPRQGSCKRSVLYNVGSLGTMPLCRTNSASATTPQQLCIRNYGSASSSMHFRNFGSATKSSSASATSPHKLCFRNYTSETTPPASETTLQKLKLSARFSNYIFRSNNQQGGNYSSL